nr:xylulose kinase-1 [Tanacetum cinerariifolium]
RKSMLKQEFSEFRIGEAEGLHKGYDRMQKILKQLNQLKAKPEDEDINIKFLRALSLSWSQVALTLKTKGRLELLSFDDMYYKLKTLEGKNTTSKMDYWIINNDMNIWKVIQNGNSLKRTGRDRDGRVIILPPTTADEHIAVHRESKARTTLLQSIPNDHVADFYYMDDARDIWNAVKARFGGNAESKKIRKSMLKQE